jgi:hypothetical protein
MVGKHDEIQVRFEAFTLITKDVSVFWNVKPFTAVCLCVSTGVPT